MVGDASQQTGLGTGVTGGTVGLPVESKASIGETGVSPILQPFEHRYHEILDKRARLVHLLKRIASHSLRITYQQRIDDLTIEMEELEGKIACAICSAMDQMVQAYLPAAISHYLSRSKARAVPLPEGPLSRDHVRRILYRMHSGGSFYPLLFVRDLELQVYRVLGDAISTNGMRGKEIAGRTRRLAIRNRINLRRTILNTLDEMDGVESLGYVPWVWRRDSVSKRRAFVTSPLVQQAREVTAVLQEAVTKKHLALRVPRGKVRPS